MAKPDDLPRWSTDADYPAGAQPWNETATKVEPIEGKKDEGFEPKERPPAQYLNWLFNLIYLWLVWLDGLFDDNDVLNSSVNASGGDEYYHDTRTLVISPASGIAPTAADESYTIGAATGDVSWAAAATSWQVPINLPVGKHITEIRFRSKCDAGTTITMEFYVKRLGGPISAGDDDDDGTSVESSNSGANVDTAMAGLDTTVKSGGYQYVLYFETVTGVGATKLSGIEVDYDQLPP